MGKITKTDISFSSNLGSTHYVSNTSDSVFKIKVYDDVIISFSNDLLYNDGSTNYWQYYEADTELEYHDGDIIGFKGSLVPTRADGIGTFTISGNGTISISGNILALINNERMKPYQFKNLFKDCNDIVDVSNLIFPDYTVQGCYESMFEGCSTFSYSPVLPAETLTEDCYKKMFYGCASLLNIICYNVSDISDYVDSDWIYGVNDYGTFEINYNGDWNNTNKASHIPSGWTIIDEYGYPWENEYLQFDVLTDGTILWKGFGSNATYSVLTISYSKDNGTTWTDITATPEGAEINVVTGDKVLIKGNNPRYAWDKNSYSAFTGGTAKYNAKGNIMSLVYGDDFIGQTVLTEYYALSQLFNGSNIVSAEYLVFPATTLTYDCYRSTFAHCQLLIKSPKILPATVLVFDCYWYMFTDCPLMESHPELPAETLVSQCYNGMFTGCYSLTTIKCLAKEINSNTVTSFIAQQDMPPNTDKLYTFIKHPNTVWPTAVFSNSYAGIPSSWIIKNYKDK